MKHMNKMHKITPGIIWTMHSARRHAFPERGYSDLPNYDTLPFLQEGCNRNNDFFIWPLDYHSFRHLSKNGRLRRLRNLQPRVREGGEATGYMSLVGTVKRLLLLRWRVEREITKKFSQWDGGRR